MKISALPNGRATAPFGLVLLLLLATQWSVSATPAQDKPTNTKTRSVQNFQVETKASQARR